VILKIVKSLLLKEKYVRQSAFQRAADGGSVALALNRNAPWEDVRRKWRNGSRP